MNKLLFSLLLLPMLSACRPSEPPTTLIDFQNDPQVLRGKWVGQVSGTHMLTLDLTATYQSEYSYRVTGTGVLGQEALTVEGAVYVFSNQKFIQPQTSPVPQGVRLFFKAGGASSDTELFCPELKGTAAQPLWKCLIVKGNVASTAFDLKRANP